MNIVEGCNSSNGKIFLQTIFPILDFHIADMLAVAAPIRSAQTD
jgi:hypothetical protein